jgi:hypothetical protein
VGSDCVTSGCINGVVGVLLGNGDGTFQAAQNFSSGGVYAYSVAIADVNGDGKPDLLVANLSNTDGTIGLLGVLLGNGDGSFQTVVTYDTGGNDALSIAVADLNEDGNLDVVVANQCNNRLNCNEGVVGVLFGRGDGTFDTAVRYPSGGNDQGLIVGSVEIADVNLDGKPDIVVVNQGNDINASVGVLVGNGSGSFRPAITYASDGYYATSVAVADVNGDGKPDIMVANRCMTPGSACYASSDGSVGVLINISLTSTKTTVQSSMNPSTFGQGVTFTASVTKNGAGTPTGRVIFFDGTTKIGNRQLGSNGMARFTTSSLSIGTHSITATYTGDADFARSTSPVLYQTVQSAEAP